MAASAAAPTLPTLEFSRPATSRKDSTAISSESSPVHERLDSGLTSPRSSLSSCSTDSLRTNPSAKPGKRVRFEESVCCSYFDIDAGISQAQTQPKLQRKASFWDRFKQKNVSADQVNGMPLELQALKRRNFSADVLELKASTASRSRHGETMFSVHQPLRESAGRRYSRAETQACWRSEPVTQKGDWGDLLSNPRQNRLIA